MTRILLEERRVAIVDLRLGRLGTAAAAAGLLLSACTLVPTPSATDGPTPASTAQLTPEPPVTRAGGTIYLLTDSEQFSYLDPQRIYMPEDLAFLGATLYRSLVAYATSPDPVQGTTLVPDLATDVGRPADGGRTWSFTLRDGVTFQTGAPITCEDIRYGVSRTFATDRNAEGPLYAIAYLDIPGPSQADTEAGFRSRYHGPYASTAEQQALFDEAVECSPDLRTITFHLNRPVPDFNDTTTLGFSPVPRSADTGQTYGEPTDAFPVSSGPYMIERYKPGTGGELVLVRNPGWSATSDPIRKAYPDRWVVELGVDPEAINGRVIAAAGADAFALPYANLIQEGIGTVFAGGSAPIPEFAARAVSGFDPFVRYHWIDVEKVPNARVRQAMMVALDREALLAVYGGELFGALADGVLKPTIGRDYAPTGIWDTYFGQQVPAGGDPDLARKLILESGEDAPVLTFTAPDTPTSQRAARVIIDSLARAGISVTYEPTGHCFGCGIDYSHADFGNSGWGPDWANASTVIPRLFTQKGDWNLSHVDDEAFERAVDEALATLDRGEQAGQWQALNRQVVQNAWVIPTIFGRTHRLAGTKVGPLYLWPAYSSWPYREMFVTP